MKYNTNFSTQDSIFNSEWIKYAKEETAMDLVQKTRAERPDLSEKFIYKQVIKTVKYVILDTRRDNPFTDNELKSLFDISKQKGICMVLAEYDLES